MDKLMRNHVLASIVMALIGLFLLTQGWEDLGGFLMAMGVVGIILYLIYDQTLDEDKDQSGGGTGDGNG